MHFFRPMLRLASAPWRWFIRRAAALLLIPFGLAASAGPAMRVLWTPVVKSALATIWATLLRRLLIEDPAGTLQIRCRDDRVAELADRCHLEIARGGSQEAAGLAGMRSPSRKLHASQRSTEARVDWRQCGSPSVPLASEAVSPHVCQKRHQTLPSAAASSARGSA